MTPPVIADAKAAVPFLKAIIQAPDDDAPRLVFADWLEEQGDPYAEFIRGHLEWHRLSVKDPRREEIETRLRQLRYCYEEWWFNPFRQLGGRDTRVVRGFIESLCMDVDAFLQNGRDILARTPLRHLQLQKPNPPLARIQARQVCDTLPARRLRTLDLSRCLLTDPWAEALADCRRLDTLETLDVSANRLSDAGGLALVRSKTLLRLKRLDLRFQERPLSPETREALRERFGDAVQV